MMCCGNSEEEKYENGEEENRQKSKIPDDDERKVDPGTARNTEEPQGTPLMQSYISNVFMTGIMSEWAMRNQRLNTGVAIFHIQVKMLPVLNQV